MCWGVGRSGRGTVCSTHFEPCMGGFARPESMVLLPCEGWGDHAPTGGPLPLGQQWAHSSHRRLGSGVGEDWTVCWLKAAMKSDLQGRSGNSMGLSVLGGLPRRQALKGNPSSRQQGAAFCPLLQAWPVSPWWWWWGVWGTSLSLPTP